MTYENLVNKIGQLIIARRNAHGNDLEQKRISAKLEKLYAIKYTILEQGV